MPGLDLCKNYLAIVYEQEKNRSEEQGGRFIRFILTDATDAKPDSRLITQGARSDQSFRQQKPHD